MKAIRSMATLSFALFLASCSFTQQAQEGVADTPEAQSAEKSTDKANSKDTTTPQDAPAPGQPEASNAHAAPTAEQQAAAESVLTGVQTEAQAAPQAEAAYTPETTAGVVPPPSGGLRMGRIAPQEEAASSADAPPPAANSVELRGFRSPKLPSGLPMNIDGKLNGQR